MRVSVIESRSKSPVSLKLKGATDGTVVVMDGTKECGGRVGNEQPSLVARIGRLVTVRLLPSVPSHRPTYIIDKLSFRLSWFIRPFMARSQLMALCPKSQADIEHEELRRLVKSYFKVPLSPPCTFRVTIASKRYPQTY